jgi:hypothetical protein
MARPTAISTGHQSRQATNNDGLPHGELSTPNNDGLPHG